MHVSNTIPESFFDWADENPVHPVVKPVPVPKIKNLCAKTRPKENPYEVWRSFDGSWTWNVLKKWQADDSKPYARWFCNVVTPICPNGELGDVYVQDIESQARKVA